MCQCQLQPVTCACTYCTHPQGINDLLVRTDQHSAVGTASAPCTGTDAVGWEGQEAVGL